MASFASALRDGFTGGRSQLVAAAHFYAAALAFAWVAGAPFAAAVHAAMDGQPGARRLLQDGGIEAISEMSRTDPGLAAAAFGSAPVSLALFLPVALLLSAGAYGLAADRPERPWSGFWIAGTRRIPSYAARAVLGAAYGAAVVAAAWGLAAGVAAAFRQPSGPGAYWTGAAARGLVLAFALLHARTVLGFAFACREAAPGVSPLPGFAESVALCWRRLLPTHGMGASFLALQVLSALLGLAAARAAGEGSPIGEAAAQAGWFGVAWLRAAEIRARVALVAPESARAAVATPRQRIEDAEPQPLLAEVTECDR